MRPVIHVISLLGILCLSLVSMTGCGEKRIHVATASGAPGEKTGPSASGTNATGLTGISVDESSLKGQGPSAEEVTADTVQPAATAAPLNLAYDPNHMNESFKQNPETSIPSDKDSGSGLTNDASSLTPLNNGNDISTQSSSSTMNNSPQGHSGESPLTAQTEFQNDLSNLPTDTEPIPETFQVAKAEPSDIIREQLDKIQEEELATVSAGLEDVFFQFDSWSLTAEAKDSLERDMGWLTTDPSSLLIIEGHADQRGTQAYNMVLGKKRAMAVRDFLSQLGVDPSRLTVISYGKDKPFCQDITEVCYQLNRRGHLLVQN